MSGNANAFYLFEKKQLGAKIKTTRRNRETLIHSVVDVKPNDPGCCLRGAELVTERFETATWVLLANWDWKMLSNLSIPKEPWSSDKAKSLRK